MSELIEQGHLGDIKDAMEKSLTPGSQTFEQALVELVNSGSITREDALLNADSPTNLLWLLENSERPESHSKAMPQLPTPETDGASFSEFLLNI